MSRILLIVYNNDSYIHFFPLGLAYVASAMREEGHDVEVYHQDVYHYPEAHLTQYLSDNQYDIVGVGMCGGYYQYAKLKKLVEAIPSGIDIWVGGHMVSADPDYFRDKFGITVFKGEFNYKENIDEIPYPAWDLFPIDYYSLIRLPHSANQDRCFPVLSGRGCPFKCTFCYRMVEGYRARNIKSITEEIQILQKDYRITYIDFADELLMVNPDRTMELSEALKPLGLKWMCNGRLNIANPKILKVMKDAGCVSINYGVEAMDDEVLERMNKKLTVKQIIEGTKNTLEASLSPRLNMLWGNIGDTKETLWKAVEFLRNYDDHAELRTIRPVTPYPGSDLYYYAIEQGMLGGVEDFYENKHVNSDLASVQFTGLSDEDFHAELHEANKLIIGDYIYFWWKKMRDQAYNLYRRRDTSFRGFRQT